MSRDRDLAGYYARRAEEYDRIYELPERQADLAAMREWLADEVRGLDVVEIACGTGYWTAVAATSASTVLATDVNAEVLELARHRLSARGNVRLAVDDLWAEPTHSERGAVGVAGFFWSHVARRRLPTFLRSFHARLLPGATAILFDNRFVPGSSTPRFRTDRHGDSWQHRELADGSEHDVIKNFPDEAEIRASLAGTAVDVRYTAWTYYWSVAYRVGKEDGV